jgi:hypothetical protein
VRIKICIIFRETVPSTSCMDVKLRHYYVCPLTRTIAAAVDAGTLRCLCEDIDYFVVV